MDKTAGYDSDLGRGQIARARRKLRDRPITLIQGDAAQTGLPTASFDRVLIGLALHEMRKCGLEVVERHTTSPDWVEGILSRPERTRKSSWASSRW